MRLLLPVLLIALPMAGFSATFGGPDAVDNQLEQDKKRHPVALKDRWAERGLSLGFDYSAVALWASDALPGADDNAASGMARFYGSWALVKRNSSNTGSLVWKLEHRHSYTDTSVKGFEFGVGGLGLVTPPFSDEKTRLTNLYWKQRLADGRATFVAGFLDATDYFDVYALASPWTGFMNFAFSTGTTTVALPGDATLGIAGATMLGENWFVIAGLTDMESDPTEPFKGFETFFSDNRYFSSLELGWTSDQEQIYLNNVHLTLWHADESDKQGTNEGRGINLSASTMLGAWLPFVRAGFSEDSGTLAETSVSVGTGYYGLAEGSTLGAAVNWAEVPGTDDQWTWELFFLFKALPYLELTPDIQFIQNPALNPGESSVIMYGLRGRIFY
ncbi:carbohydrate porin [Ferrimonas balearica]|uniref:carbohydrate porin n=1 Tax=Ferrimonas balearica TaxID=44012 RepID=UPI001C99FD70|nr:carbohydrate porin [Ferrimonas balearica]MBY5920766.1 carbohydrate porin [Ferrimonas balearica]MBY5996549.1 carbohydrate porin [Ferrimonas balearica]